MGVSGLPLHPGESKIAGLSFEIPFVIGVYDGSLNAAKVGHYRKLDANASSRKLDIVNALTIFANWCAIEPCETYPYRKINHRP